MLDHLDAANRAAYRNAVRFYRYRHAIAILATLGATSPLLIGVGALLHLIQGA
jgi:hypothetical protein